MSKSSSAKLTPVPDPEDEGVKYLAIRGKIYRIEELTQKEYEDCQRKAEIPDKENEGSTVTDMVLLERLLTLKAVTIVDVEGDPAGTKLDADAWANEKYPVTSRVSVEVRRAHFMARTEEEVAASKAPNV